MSWSNWLNACASLDRARLSEVGGRKIRKQKPSRSSQQLNVCLDCGRLWKERRGGVVPELQAVGSIAWKSYLFAECESPAVKFMGRVKAPHHTADRRYIFSRTGDHDS